MYRGKNNFSASRSCSRSFSPSFRTILIYTFFYAFFSETGVCTSYGDPHYQTFDGQMFNFHGTCRYQLTSDYVSEKFTIRMRNERRYSNVYAWSKALTIHLGDSTIVLHKDLQVKVNKSDVDLPYYHLPHFQITKGSFTITLVSDIGVQVQWDGSGFIEIQVPKSFKGKVSGLCGNFNGNSKDEFMLKNGRLASSAREFGEGWSLGRRNAGCEKAPSPPVDSTVSKCRSRLRVYWRAHKRCWPIKKQFANCHKKVKPNAFYLSCIADVCQCSGRRCECEAVMAYARACRREGVAVTWGRKNTCGESLSVIRCTYGYTLVQRNIFIFQGERNTVIWVKGIRTCTRAGQNIYLNIDTWPDLA